MKYTFLEWGIHVSCEKGKHSKIWHRLSELEHPKYWRSYNPNNRWPLVIRDGAVGCSWFIYSQLEEAEPITSMMWIPFQSPMLTTGAARYNIVKQIWHIPQPKWIFSMLRHEAIHMQLFLCSRYHFGYVVLQGWLRFLRHVNQYIYFNHEHVELKGQTVSDSLGY
jgi:hypothetical protein